MKKFISMLLCLAMVLSLCAVTFAADVTATLVTDASTLKAGDQIVVVNHTGTAAMGSQNGGGYRNKVAATTTDDKTTVTVTADMAVVTLEEGTVTGTFALKVSDGYLSFTGSSNKVYTVATKTDSESWQIAIAEDGAATVTNAKTTERVLQYNSNTNQERFACYKATQNNVTIYKLGEGAPVVPETPDEPVVVPATLAEQIAEANQLANGAFLAYESTITGEITDTPTESSYTTGTYKFTVSDGTNTLLCYYVPVTGGTPAMGDTVTVTGKLTAYNGAAQFNETASATIVKKAEGGTPETPDEPETPTAPTYATEITVGTAYMLGLYSTSKSATYYFTGNMSGYYGATETTENTAVSVYVEAATGGYYLYFMDANGTKQYINLVASGTHRNFTYAATATSVFTWDADKDALYTTVEGEVCYMGTYGNYVTVGVLQTSKLKDTDYIARLYTLNGSETPDVPDVPDVPEEPEQPSGNRADFETLNSEGTGQYTQSFTTANGWTTVNSAIQVGGPSVANPAFPVVGADNTHKAVCLNGKTSAVGKLTSPTLTGGISKLTMDYTKMFTDTLLSVTITITDLSNGKTYTKTVSREEDKNTKYVVWTDEWVLETPITGDFTIEIVNDCPSASNSNKDRFTILSLAWEGAHAHDYKVTTTADCKTDGVTTYTCDCGHTYTEETPAWGHIDENLDIDCDREGCTSKVVPTADSLLSNFTANCLGSKVSTDNKYYVQGTIVEVLDAKNGIFLIDDGTGERFYFRLPVNADGASHASWAIKLTLGDKVKVYGKINKFSTSTAPNGQFWPAIQGGVVTVLEQHAHDFTYSPADCRNPATCVCGQTYGAPRGCVDADENNICDDCGKNTKYAYEYIEIRTDNNSGVHDATALTYTWSNSNFVVQVAKASGGNLYVTSNNHMRLYKNNQFVLTNKNGLTVKTIIVYLTNATQVSNFEKMLTGYTYTKNETDFTITIEVDSFETLTLINSGSTTQIKGVEFGYERQETVDKAAADVVVAQINAIGQVTLDSKATIEAVRAAYEALTDAQKALVGNLATLEAAEEALQALQQQADKEAADKKAAGVVVALIEKIGTVTKDSKAAIEAARAAYDALTDAQKALVENYETLTKAEEAFKGIANTGDNTMMFVAMAILSMTAVVALVSKKRAF